MEKLTITAVIFTMVTIVSCTDNKPAVPETATAKLESYEERISYCFGVSIAQNMKQFDTMNLDAFFLAIRDVYEGKPLQINEQEASQMIQAYIQNLQKNRANPQQTNPQQVTERQEAEKKFFEDNKSKEGVISLPSGIQYIVLKEGTGASPKLTDHVKTHYHGTLADGTVFDSSVDRKEPITFPLNGVIQGWQISLQLMKVGSKWRIFIPSNLAYGDKGAGDGSKIGPHTPLIFEVELLEINPATK